MGYKLMIYSKNRRDNIKNGEFLLIELNEANSIVIMLSEIQQG